MEEKLAASWVSFARKNKVDLDDAAMLVALTRLDRTDDAKAEQLVENLRGVAEQIKKQVVALTRNKKAMGDKLFGDAKDKLYGLLEVAERREKETRERLAASAPSEEEEDSPKLLTTSMMPLVRQLQKGGVQMKALIADGGKQAAVLIMRRDISSSRRKLLADFLQQSAGIKYFKADCAGESGRLDFLLDSAPGGLAKKVRMALREQTGLRVKVFLQFGDQTEEDDDEVPLDEGAPAADAPVGATATASDAPAGAPASAEKLAYTQRLQKVRPLLEAALRAQHPEATKLRGVVGFASEKAAAGDHAAATKALQMIERLLDTPPKAAVADAAKPDGTQGGVPSTDAVAAQGFATLLKQIGPAITAAIAAGGPAAAEIRLRASEAGALGRAKDYVQGLAVLQRLRGLLDGSEAPPVAPESGQDGPGAEAAGGGALAAWQTACTQVRGRVRGLMREIDSAGDANSSKAIIQLDSVVKNLAATPASRRQVDELEAWLLDDDVITLIEEPNPWSLDVAVRATLQPLLQGLRAQLPA